MQENKQYKSGFAALIGRPNVGKSTLLSRVTNARPKDRKITHFTTLNPNLGVVDLDGGKGFVIRGYPGTDRKELRKVSDLDMNFCVMLNVPR